MHAGVLTTRAVDESAVITRHRDQFLQFLHVRPHGRASYKDLSEPSATGPCAARHSTKHTDAKRPASSYDLRSDWHGDIRTGSGTITVGDGVFRGPYSYDSRFSEHQGTNPEQLIAAAQPGCFTMALASKLASEGHPPDLLRTNATPSHARRVDLPRAPRDRDGGDRQGHRRAAVPAVRRRREGDLPSRSRPVGHPRDRAEGDAHKRWVVATLEGEGHSVPEGRPVLLW